MTTASDNITSLITQLKTDKGTYVTKTTKINNKELSGDVTLNASDVGALPSTTTIPTVTDTYSATSSNAMSGKAVASAISNAVGSVYTVKGTKTNYSNLPSSGNTTGDVWNVTNANGNIPAGTNYVWTGTEWDALGGTVDLSGYVQSTRTINSKALSSNITLTASDVGALPSSTTIPTVTDTYSATSSDGMSGKAVASAVSGKADTRTSQTLSGSSVSLAPVAGTTYTAGTLSSITLTSIPTSDSEILISFTATDSTTLSIPNGTKYFGDLELSAGNYIISIMYGIFTCKALDVK